MTSSCSFLLVSSSRTVAYWLLDDRAHFLVDLARGLLGVVLRVRRVVAAEEDRPSSRAEGERAELAHAVLAHHRASDRGELADVVGRARRELAEEDLLGDAAAERALDLRLELLLAAAEHVALGQRHGDAERATARDDGDLVDRDRGPSW